MALLRFKNNGSWVTVLDGHLRVKSGGVWVYPAKMYIKNGGAWRDTGYAGFPGAPTGFAVNAWDYDSMSVKWTPPATGAPVTNYEIAVNNEANTVRVATYDDTASPSINFAVTKDTKYNIYIRSETATQVSAWVGPLQVAIGHAAYTTYTDDPATRAYTLAKDVVAYRDVGVGPTIPTTVDVQTITYNVPATNWTSVLSNPASGVHHSISRWGNGAEREEFLWPNASVNTTVNIADYASTGGVQGMICRGTGMSSTAGGPYVFDATITVKGIEHYTAHNAHSHPAVANSYW